MKAAAGIRVAVIVFASLVFAFAAESYFAAKCPTDDAVIAWFHTNKKTLDDLLNMVTADDEKVTYVGRGIVEVRQDASLSEARKQEYLRKLGEIRVGFFSYTRGEGAVVGLWTDAPSIIASITSAHRYKNVQYIDDIKRWHYLES
jgi:hypothetical protein